MGIIKLVTRLNILACQALLTAIVASVLLDVGMRYILNRGFVASGEFVPYLFTWFAFLAASLCYWAGEHFVVDVILNNAGKYRRAIEFVIHILELLLFSVLIYYGTEIAIAQMSQLTPYLGLPYGIVYVSVPVSATLMFIYTLGSILKIFQNNKYEGGRK